MYCKCNNIICSLVWFGLWYLMPLSTNISAISWQSVLLVEETGENHRPVSSHWQTLSHNFVSSTLGQPKFLSNLLKYTKHTHIEFALALPIILVIWVRMSVGTGSSLLMASILSCIHFFPVSLIKFTSARTLCLKGQYVGLN